MVGAVSATAGLAAPAASAGELLRFWRRRRQLSQLDLAISAGVSTRHLSFVETGRARPSREMVRRLCAHLDLPLRERNRVLLAAGYAPAYQERHYEDPDMEPLRQALGIMLTAHQPHPALIVDRTWNLLAANPAADLLTAGVDPALVEPPVNVLRLAFHPDGLSRISTPSPLCNLAFFRRLRRRAFEAADQELTSLLDELERYLPEGRAVPEPATGGPLVGSFELNTRLGGVRLFTAIATLGAPIEVTSADLAIETFLPADSDSADLLHRLAEERS